MSLLVPHTQLAASLSSSFADSVANRVRGSWHNLGRGAAQACPSGSFNTLFSLQRICFRCGTIHQFWVSRRSVKNDLNNQTIVDHPVDLIRVRHFIYM